MSSPNISETEMGERELERVSRLIVAGELVAAVAHDLRQPLTAIEMNISAALRMLPTMLRDDAALKPDAVVATVTEALHDALAQQNKMRVALQVLEDLARHRDPAFAPVDMLSITRDVVRLVASELSSRRISVELADHGPAPAVDADNILVRQALLNMVIHALECTASSEQPRGPIVIGIRPSAGETVELYVTYFGARDESVTTREFSLALARSIAETHGAILEMEGDPTAGTTIAIRWPVHRTPTSAERRS